MAWKKLLLGVVVLLVVSVLVGGAIGCCPAGEEPTPTPTATEEATPTAEATPTEPPAGGEAPTLTVGDQWVYDVTYKGETTVFTETVTDAGAAGYTTEVSFSTIMRKERLSGMGLDAEWKGSQTRMLDADLDMVGMETGIKAMGMDLLVVLEGTYEHATAKWPLTAGAEWTGNLDIDVGGLLSAGGDIEVVVEGVEDVTVPAGTFSCVKIVTSYAGGDVILEEWFSEDVKGVVKKVEDIYWDEADVFELTSYSVAE